MQSTLLHLCGTLVSKGSIAAFVMSLRRISIAQSDPEDKCHHPSSSGATAENYRIHTGLSLALRAGGVSSMSLRKRPFHCANFD